MSDLIDRQAVIEAIERDAYRHTYLDQILDIIKSMPSAQPERKTGRWIPYREKSREYIGTVLVNVSYDYWLCDACDYRVENGQPMYNFCPHCGADMRGEGRETD